MSDLEDYKIAFGRNPRSLSVDVMMSSNEGYVLYGSPFSFEMDGEMYIGQAMLRTQIRVPRTAKAALKGESAMDNLPISLIPQNGG